VDVEVRSRAWGTASPAPTSTIHQEIPNHDVPPRQPPLSAGPPATPPAPCATSSPPRIAVGRRTGAAAIQRILTEVPNDRIVSGAAVTFASDDTGLKVHYGRVIETVHPHALGQMAESARMPRTFLSYLQEQGAWGQGLAARTLNELFAHDAERHLIRSVGGQTRSMLSTKYRRLHPGMLMEAFQTACTQVGAVAYEAVCTDTRWVVKAVLQEVVEPVRDEVLALGVVIHESPHGAGATEISPFIERMWCTNKAVCSSELRRVHLGSRLDAVGVEWSDETVLADTRVMCLQIQDLVRGQLGAGAIRKLEPRCGAPTNSRSTTRSSRRSFARTSRATRPIGSWASSRRRTSSCSRWATRRGARATR
jgi:hypothetical protein